MYFILTPLTEVLLPHFALWLATFQRGDLFFLEGIPISGQFLRPVPVFITIVSGNLFADMVWYHLGKYVQLERIKRLGTRLGMNLQIVDDLALEIQNHAPRFLFLAKLTVGLPVPSLIATGLSRVPIKRWIGMLMLAEIIRSSVFVTLLFLYASAIGKASREMQAILLTITSFVVISGIYWWKKRRKKSDDH